MNETYIHNTSQFMLPSVLFITSEPRAELLFIFIIRTFSFSDFSSIIFHIYHVLWGMCVYHAIRYYPNNIFQCTKSISLFLFLDCFFGVVFFCFSFRVEKNIYH